MTDAQRVALHRALLDSVGRAILVADDAAIYVEVNEEACRLLQRPREDIVGHHLSEFIIDGTRDVVDAQWGLFLKEGAQAGFFPMRVGERVVTVHFSARANVVPGFHCSFLTESQESSRPENDEGWLTICAWTQRVRWRGQWMHLGDYLLKAHGVHLTHGMCPEVLDRYLAAE